MDMASKNLGVSKYTVIQFHAVVPEFKNQKMNSAEPVSSEDGAGTSERCKNLPFFVSVLPEAETARRSSALSATTRDSVRVTHRRTLPGSSPHPSPSAFCQMK